MNVQAAVNYLAPQSERAFYVIRGARQGEVCCSSPTEDHKPSDP